MDITANTFGLILLLVFITITNASWGSPGSGQYHIQTDEGPERYFRYQTDNGQYRKEKRLEDGTVIGTDAWIDALGYLRQNDYIADNQGYRILKTKTVYVGVDRPIQDAIKAAKKKPATAGILVKPQNSIGTSINALDQQPKKSYISHHSTTTTTTIRPAVKNLNPLGYDHYENPNIFVRPHSEPIDSNYLPSDYGAKTTTPSSIYVTPAIKYPTSTVKPDAYDPPLAVYPPSSTPAPPSSDYGTPLAVYKPNELGPSSTPESIRVSSTRRPDFSSTALPPESINDINNNLLPPSYQSNYSPPSQRFYQSTTPAPVNVPLFNRNVGYSSTVSPYYLHPNQIGDGYHKQFPLYDGVATTANGFRYYLPRQYHEEENSGSQDRAGSFGYIDPFGIRRVIYYNASPEGGFQHRKNNRYVGFDATPYDPRPL